MRLISFSMTLEAFRDGRKTVTRRVGWKALKPGTRLMAVEKAQGLKKGEKVVHLGEIEVVSVRREPLSAIDGDDVRREGFDFDSPTRFVTLFARAHGLKSASAEVTRIEFRKIPSKPCDRCGLCDLARFAAWRERITAGLGESTDEDSPRLALVYEIHADIGRRFPLGIAVRLGHVIAGLACCEEEGDAEAVRDLEELEQDEEIAATFDASDCCEASRELFIPTPKETT